MSLWRCEQSYCVKAGRRSRKHLKHCSGRLSAAGGNLGEEGGFVPVTLDTQEGSFYSTEAKMLGRVMLASLVCF